MVIHPCEGRAVARLSTKAFSGERIKLDSAGMMVLCLLFYSMEELPEDLRFPDRLRIRSMVTLPL